MPIKYPYKRLPQFMPERDISPERDVSLQRSIKIDRMTTDPFRIAPNYTGLRPYQVEGVDWLRQHSMALLADEMGLGKTPQVLRAFPDGARVIVLCPAHLQLMWEQRTKEWAPRLTPILDEELREPEVGELHIHSYDSLPDPPSSAKVMLPGRNLRGVFIVLDEAHYVMSHTAARTYRTRLLTKQSKRVWAVTGTPLPNHAKQLWGVLASAQIAFKVFGSWDNFQECYNVTYKKIGYNKATGEDKYAPEYGEPTPDVAELLKPYMLRRLRKQVAPDLPDKEYAYLKVRTPDELVFMLDEISRKWTDKTELPPFELLSAVRASLARARIPEAVEFAKNACEQTPLAVFSAHVDPVIAMKQIDGAVIMTGEESAREKKEAVDAFQRGDKRLFACTIKTATGFDLTRAPHAFFVDQSYTPGENSQAEDRLPRIGQKADKVLITIMHSDHPVDVHVMQLIKRKETTISTSLGDPA